MEATSPGDHAGRMYPSAGFEVRYQHATIEGTPYEAGRLQGEFLQQATRTLVSYEPPEPAETARRMRRLYDAHCPGLIEETQGIADSLGLPFEKALFCAAIGAAHGADTGPATRGCTHAVVLPSMTADHHLYVARNYDMALTDADLRLCTTRIRGRAGHLGFSDMCLGRLDGLNEHGLCVTLSAVWNRVPEDWAEPNGLHYAVAVRAALDRCRTVEQALELWQRMPIGSNGKFLVADRLGAAALVEIAGRKRAIQRIGLGTDEQYLVAANHYTLLDLSDRSPHSTGRYDRLSTWLRENAGQIDGSGLRAFLDRGWDTGVSGYSPEHRAGTLWSMVFDVTAGTGGIRFGPPPQDRWHSFSLDGPVGASEYTALFPNQSI
jgi:predicted choloylglycine hydrolase